MQGRGRLDHRTDIYSLGVILYEMLTGRPPFIAEGVGELFAKHMLEDRRRSPSSRPNAPPHMAAAIMKALAKDPSARFQNMEDFRKAIVGEIKVAPPASTGRAAACRNAATSTMSQTISARASTTLSSASSEIDDGLEIKPKRTKLFVGAGGGAALLVVGYFALSGKQKAPPPAHPARRDDDRGRCAADAPAAAAVPIKKTVTIRFEAEPAGAHVFRKKDDKDLGVVPVEIQLAKDAGKVGRRARVRAAPAGLQGAAADRRRRHGPDLPRLPGEGGRAGRPQEGTRTRGGTAARAGRATPSTKTASPRPRSSRIPSPRFGPSPREAAMWAEG